MGLSLCTLSTVTMELTVRLTKPHPKQLAVKRSKARRKLLKCGRRFGKTALFSQVAVEGLLAGKRVLEAAPTADQTAAFWQGCKEALQPLVSAGVCVKNESDRTFSFGKGHIHAKTAWNADTLRGDYADLLLLDEYSYMDPDAWAEVGAPMLLDNDGDAWFAFTPNRKNHAFVLFQRALADTTGRWEAFDCTSMDNPYLSAAALADITKDMTEEAYRQEILAEFLEGEGAVFRNIAACTNATPTTPAEHEGHYVVAGLDLAKQADFTALSIVCRDCHRELHHDRYNQIDYVYQMQRVKATCETWGVHLLVVDETGVGAPIVERLRLDMGSVSIQGFVFTPASKGQAIESLALAFERGELAWLPDPVWTGELEAYERKVSPVTGRSQYSAPEGLHDDTVIARALALTAVNTPSGADLVGWA